jgi:phage baseplate assembly protein W
VIRTPAGFVSPSSWPLLSVPDEHGQLAFPSYEDSVRQMIQVILLTRPGEQLMHPEFGAGISQFLNEPNTPDTRRRLHDAVVAALAAYEQRIQLEDVAVSPVDREPTAVRIDVFYQLRRTGARKQVALTLTLGG